MLKRFLSIITISLILIGSFFSIYSFDYPVYADSTTDGWMSVTTDQQMAQAFMAYCKSRDLTIEGSVADSVTSFTTKAFQDACRGAGIDLNTIQAHLKYNTDGNLGIKFLFDRTGVSLYNRIFSQFCQDHDLFVGESYDDQQIFSGLFYKGHLVGVTTSINDQAAGLIVDDGDVFQPFDGFYCEDNIGGTYTIQPFDQNITFSIVQNEGVPLTQIRINYNNSNKLILERYDYNDIKYLSAEGYLGYFILQNSPDRIYFGVLTHKYKRQSNGDIYNISDYVSTIVSNNLSSPLPDVIITVNTGDTVINNNNYEENNYTTINNEGDVNNYYGDDEPDPDDPIQDDPTPDTPTIPDSGGWQDFTLPEMPNDWLIYGMEKKFPFDIPFNIMFALSLLNHEPEIPKFEGDIDLKVCTWHYDIDLTPFDDLATILRKFEVLAFIIGLAILTKNLINWG